jgi:hypothetical protein
MLVLGYMNAGISEIQAWYSTSEGVRSVRPASRLRPPENWLGQRDSGTMSYILIRGT